MMTVLPRDERIVIMDYKETIDNAIWTKPDPKGRIRRLDMRTCQDVFDELKNKLESAGLLPDEYFNLNVHIGKDEKIPDYLDARCSINYGESEGIYLDIELNYYDADEKYMGKHFATGKTLGDTTADFYKMSLAAGECSMLLNGLGRKVENNVKKVLILDEAECTEFDNALVLQKQFNEAVGRSNETVYSLMDSLKDNPSVFEDEDEDDLEM